MGSEVLDHLLEPIAHLLDNPSIEDICVNGPNSVFTYAGGSYTRQDLAIDADWAEDLAIVAGAQRRQDIHHGRPLLSTDLRGRGRLQAIVYPCVPEDAPCLVIRRGSSAWPTLEELAATGLFAATKHRRASGTDAELLELYRNHRWEEFFTRAAAIGKTILGCGVTGSGKTHFSKAAVSAISPAERIITIEDSPELIGLQEHHPNSVHLYYDKGGSGVSAADLVECGLRMRPDRLILQEIRDGQAALAFILALQTGHRGITTIHADNCEGAFDRLRFVVKQTAAGAAVSDNDLMTQLRSLVDIVVHISVDGGIRSMGEVWFKDACVA